MTLLSVIIPTCNRPDLLSRCLDCVKPGSQTLGSDLYEVIVSDDGKKVPSQSMVREKYPWAKWIEGPSRGPASNRNNGAKNAKGKWLVFTDDDCLPEPNWLLAYFNSINDDRLVYEGKTISKVKLVSPLVLSPINTEGGNLWSCNFMIQKDLFLSLGGFDENFLLPHLEDCDLNNRVKKSGFSGYFVPDAVVDHPPRRLVNGKTMGRYHKFDVYYFKKWKEGITINQLIKIIILTRLRTIKNFPVSKDSFLAFYYMFQEVFVVLMNFSKWQKEFI